MKVAVIGAGAMGALYGGYLSRQGADVWLNDTWPEHVRSINTHGLVLQNSEGEHVIPVKATTVVTDIGPADLVIIFVKSMHTGTAVEQAQCCIRPNTLVLTLQNGLGNIEAITAHIDSLQVLAGVTSNGSTLLAPGKIRHAGVGKTFFGPVAGVIPAGTDAVVRLFNAAGLETELTRNPVGMIWSKLLVNVGVNALTAITGLLNGDLLQYPELLEMMDSAVAEGTRVAMANGIILETNNVGEHVRQVCRATATNRSSMLQDVTHKRKTEIDAINGALVREAAKQGIDVPYNRMLTNLVKVLEKRY